MYHSQRAQRIQRTGCHIAMLEVLKFNIKVLTRAVCRRTETGRSFLKVNAQVKLIKQPLKLLSTSSIFIHTLLHM